jgi:uncharacterized membrane protein
MSDPQSSPNPYAAPVATTLAATPEGIDTIIPNGRSVSAGQGVSWIGTGWQYFTAAPLIWIVNIVILFVILIVLAFIPFLGNIATNILFPIFGAGLIACAHAAHRGESVEVGHLFEGFKKNTGNLAILGLLYLVCTIAIFIVIAILMALTLGVSGVFGALTGGNDAELARLFAAAGIGMVLIILVALALSIPVAMAFWFAPALVLLHDQKPFEAIGNSFFGCLKNILPFLLWGIIMMVLFIVGAIPLGLGLLVVVPLVYTSTYAAYRDIYIGD